MDSDQKTLNMAVIGTDTLARGARTRITSIQGLGIAASTLTLYDSSNAAAENDNFRPTLYNNKRPPLFDRYDQTLPVITLIGS